MSENNQTSNYKVFIVDDDKFLLDMYALKFSKSGASVENALNGTDALRKIEAGYRPDVLLIDVVMPGLSGLDMIAEIRKKKLIEKVPIVVLSNQSEDASIQRAKDLGVQGYIVKASTIPSEVVEQINKIVEESRK